MSFSITNIQPSASNTNSSFSSPGTTTENVIIRFGRSISQSGSVIVIPNCVIEETNKDDLQVTDHPVEVGSVITDHAFMKPLECSVRWAWSNSAQGSESYILDIYQQIQALQQSRIPLQLITGKRNYSNINMLILSHSAVTNDKSEYILMLSIVFRQIILVSTSTTSVPPQSAQAIPQQTSPVTPQGVQNPISQTPAQNGGLTQTTGFLGGAGL